MERANATFREPSAVCGAVDFVLPCLCGLENSGGTQFIVTHRGQPAVGNQRDPRRVSPTALPGVFVLQPLETFLIGGDRPAIEEQIGRRAGLGVDQSTATQGSGGRFPFRQNLNEPECARVASEATHQLLGISLK